MPNEESHKFEINALINSAFVPKETLRGMFEAKLSALDTSVTAILPVLDMESRALNGILDGTKKMVDFTNLIKIANFLQVPLTRVVELFAAALEANFSTGPVTVEKVQFIKDNFDLAALRKARLIDTITDFRHIEQRLLLRLGLKSIFDYKKPDNHVAFSAGILQPKNDLSRSVWIRAAMNLFEELENPYDFNRQGLIEFIPLIRWHSTNVELGLVDVVKTLYKLGVTVIYQPPMPSLQLRGATMAVYNKPCIVLTDIMGFYGTLWFALCHEIFHVLFDWPDIEANSYHATEDGDDIPLTVKEKDRRADDFARSFLFSKEKSAGVDRYLYDRHYIADLAADSQVHESIIYLFLAYDNKSSKKFWARAREMSPPVEVAVSRLTVPWEEELSWEKIEVLKNDIYN
ncbi:ImmA/IrrE family metallo-endopeptidase [Chitinophaga rhizosphaerae]|uniref:ImmA/IrrE family metallo-endopeptidase n=1 Tax=Chitinophaga rhizosphaerae TaxID=1864947 RepID=UPI000F80E01A|nr:hypothetical protein [Chitinophaga rhizosphaerae]